MSLQAMTLQFQTTAGEDYETFLERWLSSVLLQWHFGSYISGLVAGQRRPRSVLGNSAEEVSPHSNFSSS